MTFSYSFIVMKRHHHQSNSYKGHLIGTYLQFQRFSPYYSRREADMVLEEALRILHLNPKTARRRLPSIASQEEAWLEYKEPSEPTYKVTHFLQQFHNYSNKATPASSATSHGPRICKPPQTPITMETAS